MVSLETSLKVTTNNSKLVWIYLALIENNTKKEIKAGERRITLNNHVVLDENWTVQWYITLAKIMKGNYWKPLLFSIT